MMATNHVDQLGEIYPTMLNALNCTFGVSFSRFHCCGRQGHGLWPPWFVAIMVVAVNGTGPWSWNVCLNQDCSIHVRYVMIILLDAGCG